MYAKIKKEMLSRTVEYLLCLTVTETASVHHETKVSVFALARCKRVKLFKHP